MPAWHRVQKHGKVNNHGGILCDPKIKRSRICDLPPEKVEKNSNSGPAMPSIPKTPPHQNGCVWGQFWGAMWRNAFLMASTRSSGCSHCEIWVRHVWKIWLCTLPSMQSYSTGLRDCSYPGARHLAQLCKQAATPSAKSSLALGRQIFEQWPMVLWKWLF